LGRIYCSGTKADYAAVHALQDKMKAVPLSAYGKPFTPPPATVNPGVDMKTAVRSQVDALDAASFFKLFAQLLKTNPPTPDDAPMVAKLAKMAREANWLPAPADTFILMMRLYWPKEKPPSILDGSWKVPEVKEVG
ncbi:MAG: DUF1214 domain-containing protein, partial [Archangium sp.]